MGNCWGAKISSDSPSRTAFSPSGQLPSILLLPLPLILLLPFNQSWLRVNNLVLFLLSATVL
jgi:hypothetical protein